MNKILNIGQLNSAVQKLKKEEKSIVLTGGCFDILHTGHIKFLEAAKNEGDLLFVLLESDENIKLKKGGNRPLNHQKHRALVLSALQAVDYIIPLSGVTKDEEYDKLIFQIKPNVIAMTKGDKAIEQREKQCQKVGAKLKIVIDNIENKSTSHLIDTINT